MYRVQAEFQEHFWPINQHRGVLKIFARSNFFLGKPPVSIFSLDEIPVSIFSLENLLFQFFSWRPSESIFFGDFHHAPRLMVDPLTTCLLQTVISSVLCIHVNCWGWLLLQV